MILIPPPLPNKQKVWTNKRDKKKLLEITETKTLIIRASGRDVYDSVHRKSVPTLSKGPSFETEQHERQNNFDKLRGKLGKLDAGEEGRMGGHNHGRGNEGDEKVAKLF